MFLRTRSLPTALAALLLGPAALVAGGAASAFPFQVESWSVSNAASTFADDFEDGVLDPSYVVPCGHLGAGDESGGALSLGSPDTGGVCGGGAESQVVGSLLPISGEGSVEADYRYSLPGIDEAWGIQLAAPDGSDLIALVVARTALGSGEVLAVTLFDEEFAATGDAQDLLATAALSFLPSGFAADGIRLALSTVLQDGLLVPDARFSIDGGAWLDVLAGPGEGALDPDSGPFGGALLATRRVPEPAALLLLTTALVWSGLRGRRSA